MNPIEAEVELELSQALSRARQRGFVPSRGVFLSGDRCCVLGALLLRLEGVRWNDELLPQAAAALPGLERWDAAQILAGWDGSSYTGGWYAVGARLAALHVIKTAI